jgi:hypothetical protein
MDGNYRIVGAGVVESLGLALVELRNSSRSDAHHWRCAFFALIMDLI